MALDSSHVRAVILVVSIATLGLAIGEMINPKAHTSSFYYVPPLIIFVTHFSYTYRDFHQRWLTPHPIGLRAFSAIAGIFLTVYWPFTNTYKDVGVGGINVFYCLTDKGGLAKDVSYGNFCTLDLVRSICACICCGLIPIELALSLRGSERKKVNERALATATASAYLGGVSSHGGGGYTTGGGGYEMNNYGPSQAELYERERQQQEFQRQQQAHNEWFEESQRQQQIHHQQNNNW